MLCFILKKIMNEILCYYFVVNFIFIKCMLNVYFFLYIIIVVLSFRKLFMKVVIL